MYWDPFDELERMHEEMDRMFNRFWGQPERPLIGHKDNKGQALEHVHHGFRAPRCHLQETESNIIAAFEIPGVDKGDIDLRVHDDHIEIKVESKQEKKDKEKGSYMSRQSSFFRRLPLPVEVDSDKAIAEYRDGVVRVEMPKRQKEQKKGKKVDVK